MKVFVLACVCVVAFLAMVSVAQHGGGGGGGGQLFLDCIQWLDPFHYRFEIPQVGSCTSAPEACTTVALYDVQTNITVVPNRTVHNGFFGCGPPASPHYCCLNSNATAYRRPPPLNPLRSDMCVFQDPGVVPEFEFDASDANQLIGWVVGPHGPEYRQCTDGKHQKVFTATYLSNPNLGVPPTGSICCAYSLNATRPPNPPLHPAPHLRPRGDEPGHHPGPRPGDNDDH